MITATLTALALLAGPTPCTPDPEPPPPPTVRCWPGPELERPQVRTVDGLVTVDNRCNQVPGLVIVWRMYENSSETFTAQAGTYTTHPTLHTGRIRVWVRYGDQGYTYRKVMR